MRERILIANFFNYCGVIHNCVNNLFFHHSFFAAYILSNAFHIWYLCVIILINILNVCPQIA